LPCDVGKLLQPGWYGRVRDGRVAAAAFAADQLIQCKAAPCYGSSNDDKILERKGNDRDVVKGGTGYDKINVADGDRFDTASGGKAGDWCIVDSRSEVGTGCTRVTVR
jgi:hypothetical protein